MNIFKLLFVGIALAPAVGASADEVGKSQKLYIIEGYFFDEIPVDMSLMDGMMSLSTAAGTQAFGMIMKEPLPDEAKRYAIPAEQIPEAGVLLEMYNERLSRMIRLTLSEEETIRVGDVFPQFTARDIDGKRWSSADVEGKVMVLNCWFTGCGPCRAEMPELSRWRDEMPDVMFFSATYERPETARPVLEKTGFNWIHLVGDTQFKEYIGANGYPMTIVIGKDGRVAQVEYGTSPLQRNKLRETIESLR